MMMLQMGPSELIYVFRDGLNCKIESAKFTKDAKEQNVVAFDGKGASTYVFARHGNFIYFMDEQKVLKKLEYDFPKRKFRLVLSLQVRFQNEIALTKGFEFNKVQMTEKLLYHERYFSLIYDSQVKDLDQLYAPEYEALPPL